MHRFVDEKEELDYGAQPHTVARSCTDVPCCLVFLVFLAGFGWVTSFGLTHGDPARFLHLPNSQMQICGKDEGVQDSPFLYFCRDSQGLNPQNTICVSECPVPPNVPSTLCPAGMTEGYETRPFAGILCLPKDPTEAVAMEQVLGNNGLRQVLKVVEVFKSWKAILAVTGIAIILGFLYLFFLETCAFCIFWGSMSMSILVLTALGGYMIYGVQARSQWAELSQAHLEGQYQELPDLTTGDAQQDLYIGAGLLTFAAILTCFSCCACGVVNTALSAIREAADCITDIPTLLIHPFIDLAIKIVTFVLLVVGFWYLLSTADTAPTPNAFGQFQIDYDNTEYIMMGYYLFMAYWIMELLDALSNFVIAYAVQLWYATTRGGLDSSEAPCFPTVQGFFAGVTYHLGTFAFGSCIIATVRGLRDIMFLITKQSQASGNSVMACCGCCCTCCLDCFNRFLKFMTKNAYMDTAMNSNGFCKAAHHAVILLIEHASEVATLNTATILFNLSGVAGIMACGTASMVALCKYWPALADPTSPDYVEDKVTMYGVAAVISGLVSLPFMLLLDQVSDTILFCFCVQKKRTPPPPPYQDEDGEPGSLFCGCCCSNPPANSVSNEQRRALISG